MILRYKPYKRIYLLKRCDSSNSIKKLTRNKSISSKKLYHNLPILVFSKNYFGFLQFKRWILLRLCHRSYILRNVNAQFAFKGLKVNTCTSLILSFGRRNAQFSSTNLLPFNKIRIHKLHTSRVVYLPAKHDFFRWKKNGNKKSTFKSLSFTFSLCIIYNVFYIICKLIKCVVAYTCFCRSRFLFG